MYFPRKAQEQLREHLNSASRPRDVLLVSGARQVGKSTMIEKVLENRPNVLTLNFQDNPKAAAEIDRTGSFGEFEELLSLRYGFKDAGGILYIDEAQASLRLGSYVRFMKERWKDTVSIISGSMLSDLFKDRYPVGRVKEIVLRPFTFEEYLKAVGRDTLLEFLQTYLPGNTISDAAHETALDALQDYFLLGGLPEVILYKVEGENWHPVRDKIVQGFRHDFALKYGESRAALVWDAFEGVSQYIGSPSKYSQIRHSNEHGYKILPGIFSQLEKWHLILKSPQRGSQPERSLHPKRYMFDTGAAQEFRAASRPIPPLLKNSTPQTRKMLGGLIENHAATHLTFLFSSIRGYKEKTFEIDFILEKDSETVLPVEIKANTKNKRHQFSSLRKYMETYHVPAGLCLNLAKPETVRLSRGSLLSLPIYLIEQLPRLLL